MGLDTENAVNINAVPSAKKTSENTKTTCTNPEQNAGENQLQGMAPRIICVLLLEYCVFDCLAADNSRINIFQIGIR